MLGLGHTLVAGSALSEYAMTKAFNFDGTNDGFITNTLSGVDPANGSAKPVSNSLSVAAWVRLDDGTDDPYEAVGQFNIVGPRQNGGWVLQHTNYRFYFKARLKRDNGTTFDIAMNSTFRAMRNDNGSTRFLKKPDNWHFVVGTLDLEDASTAVIGNIYVDGNRSQAGAASGGAGNGPNGETFGAEPETSDSKKTETPTSGSLTFGYDEQANREGQEVDIVIGAFPSWTFATDTTGLQSQYWQGYIGDLAIWDGIVLSQDEIKKMYNLHKPIDMSTIQTSNLRGYWRPTLGLKDSVSGNTGTLVDDGAIATAAPSADVSGYDGYQ